MSGPARAWCLAAGWLLAGTFAAAEAPRITVATEPRGRVSDTQPFRLLVQVEGDGSGDASIGALPPMSNLRVVSGPFTSRNSSFSFDASGAHRSSTVLFVYTLVAERPGEAQIPPITVRVGSTSYRTEPVDLEVVAGPTGPAPPRGATRRGSEGARDERREADGDVYLEATLGEKEVWAGQPVFLDVTLYTTVQVAQLGWVSVPSFANFWTEDIEVDSEADRRRVTIGGRDYLSIPLVRKALVPTTAGDATIDPFAAQIQYRSRQRDFFSDFFSMGAGQQTILRKSKPLPLRVKPLPESGKPASFGGAVGTYRMKVELDRKEARVNDAVALRVAVEGEGSLQSVPPPALGISGDFKIFDPKVTSTAKTGSGRLISKKTWEWVVVPLTPGSLRLPTVRFGVFDPAAGSYKELVHDAGTLAVLRGEGAVDTAVARADVRLERQEIRFIKQRKGDLATAHRPLHRRGAFAALAVLPFLVGPVLILWGRRQARLRADRGFARHHRSHTRARKRLKGAAKRVEEPGTAFHEEIASALVDFVADRFDRSASGLTYDLAEGLLEGRGVDVALRRRLRAILESCDFARYVPEAASPKRRDDLLREAHEVLDALERAL